MGLDLSTGWHGGYGLFSLCREELARAAGYPFTKVDRFGAYARSGNPEHLSDAVDIPWDRFELKNFQGEWDSPPEDPLLLLIVHSDCDGEIPARYVPFLATRLEALAPLVDTAIREGYIREKCEELAANFRAAADAGDGVEFG